MGGNLLISYMREISLIWRLQTNRNSLQADYNNVRLSIGSLCQPDTPDTLIYQKYIFTHPSAQQSAGNVFIKRLSLVEFQLN